jgi:lipoprotein-releasing system permease protein
VAAQALVARGDDVLGAMVRGISPADEIKVTDLEGQVSDGSLKSLIPGEWGILLGSELARQLRVRLGDKVTLVAPGGQLTPAGVMPRLKQFTVTGLFSSGHYQYDSALALVHIDDAAKLFRVEGVSGVQLKLRDLHRAREVSHELQAMLGEGVQVRDWTRTNQQWFAAVQVEKRMMSIILTLIVAVASFNLVSMLVMTVTDKRADIAILRTLGASPRSVMAIFMVQGAAAGVIGTFAGVAMGLLVAFNVDAIVSGIERMLHINFLDPSIYLITRMPSDPQRDDIIPIVLISLVLAFVATIYPSWRASRIQPAEALRYE